VTKTAINHLQGNFTTKSISACLDASQNILST